MALTPLPTPPSRTDPANFATRSDAWLAALSQLVAEINALPMVSITGSLNGVPIGNVTPSTGAFASAGSTTALTVTQTGSGNAFVVEDQASDATPFVIESTGRTGIGSGVFEQIPLSSSTLGTCKLQILSGNQADSSGLLGAYSVSPTIAPNLVLARSRGALNAHGLVVDGDSLGRFVFEGSDGQASGTGAGFLRAAVIEALVDGTAAAGAMPGRLVFSTTPSGSSTPVERMRIDSVGAVGIGTGSLVAMSLNVGKALTGATSAQSIRNGFTVSQDVTSTAYGVRSQIATEAAAFTLGSLVHFIAEQSTIGAGSAVTNQYGFYAQSNLTGATNNYGFFSNIAAAAGRWSVYAGGTAANYFAGDTAIAGNAINKQPLPVAASTTSTLTTTALLGRIITSAPAAAITLTLPTGTLLEAALPSIAADQSVDWSVINTNATYAATIAAGTDHTVLGNMTVAPSTSAMFRSRRTAANTFITYRVA